MNKISKLMSTAAVALTLTAAGTAFGHSFNDGGIAQSGTPSMGKAQMQKMDGAMSMKKMEGAMGQGMMMGQAAHHAQFKTADKNLSSDDVRKILDGRFAWMGHKRLQVGEINKSETGVLVAEVNTVDGSLVMRMEVDPKTGAMRHVPE